MIGLGELPEGTVPIICVDPEGSRTLHSGSAKSSESWAREFLLKLVVVLNVKKKNSSSEQFLSTYYALDSLHGLTRNLYNILTAWK